MTDATTPPTAIRPDTTWIDAQIGYLLRRASATMAADYAKHGDALRPVLVSMLSVIDANPGIGQTELGTSLGIQRPNVAPLVADLVGRELVERRRSTTDARRLELHCTPRGIEALARGRSAIEAHEARVTAALSDAERSVLHDLLTRIVER